MQINVNSTNFSQFGFSAKFDILNRRVVFDISQLTTWLGNGAANVQGISFYLKDSKGLVLSDVNWLSPQIPRPNLQTVYNLDLSNLDYAFLFQSYEIYGAIKDQDGQIYSTTPVYKSLCEPVNMTDLGYVPGVITVNTDCINNIIQISEATVRTYNGVEPFSESKAGILYYPIGTISAVPFANTPFTNNQVYTGHYRITNTTLSDYDLGDAVYVEIAYKVDQEYDVTCANKLQDIMCCIMSLQDIARKRCDDAVGQNARQQLDDITIPLMTAISKEISGLDASSDVTFIKEALRCDCGCGGGTVGRNEMQPINPAINTIALTGIGGTTISSSFVVGNTRYFNIKSNIYQVVKAIPSDPAFTITTDTTVPNVVKYVIAINYTVLTQTILTTIKTSPSLVTQLNALITSSIDMTGLTSCPSIVDLSKADYALSQNITVDTLIKSLTANGTVYLAPANLSAADATAVVNWLSTLSLGTFNAIVVGGILTIISSANSNTLSSVSFGSPDTTTAFASTRKTLKQIIQAILTYLCNLTAQSVLLYQNLSICLFDYNGNPVSQQFLKNANTQADYNLGISQAICNIVSKVNSLSGVTCTSLKNLFKDIVGGSLLSTDRLYGTIGGNCAGVSPKQLATWMLNTINNDTTLKSIFCGIDCSVPGSCPDIASINMNVAGGNIAIYGVVFQSATTASQNLTVQYRLTGTSVWSTATNSLLVNATGNVATNPPFQISPVTPGAQYDVYIVNTCGGDGSISRITIPTGTVYTNSYLVNSVLYALCGGSPITLYSSQPFGSGVTMYTDSGLTTPLTGDNYIAPVATGNIYNISSTTGVVGAATGSSCNAGVSGSYQLGNNTGTICAAAVQTLYTNGAFAVGGTLYTDSGLTTPVTGYSYVVNIAQNVIYTLNSVTGQIGVSTGLSCSVNINVSLNAKASSFAITSVPITMYYSINGGLTWTYIASQYPSTTPTFYGTISVPSGSDILIGCKTASGTPVVFGLDPNNATNCGETTPLDLGVLTSSDVFLIKISDDGHGHPITC